MRVLVSSYLDTIKKYNITSKIAIMGRFLFKPVRASISNLCPQAGHDDALSARLFLQVGQAFIVPKI